MLCEMYLRLEFEGQNLEKELNVLNGLQVYRSSRAPTTKHYNDVLVLFLTGSRKPEMSDLSSINRFFSPRSL